MSDFWSSDPYTTLVQRHVNYVFHVTIGLDMVGSFQAVENITQEVQVETWHEGGRNHSPHVLFGKRRYGQLSLRWGIGVSPLLFNWIEAVNVGRHFRRYVMIFHLTRAYIPLRVYLLKGAFPVSWKGGNLEAGDSTVETEEIVLAYDDLVLLVNRAANVVDLGSSLASSETRSVEAGGYQWSADSMSGDSETQWATEPEATEEEEK